MTKNGETLYQGQDEWINSRTGEKIIADEMVKKVTRQGFMITYLSTIIDMIDDIGNKKMQVVKYILNNMSLADNTLIITTAELIKKTKTSVNTVQNTLKTLEKAGIITRRTGALMVSEKLIHRGSHQKQAFLLTRFKSFNSEEEGQAPKMIDITPVPPKKLAQSTKPDAIKDQISLIEQTKYYCEHCKTELKLTTAKDKYYCPLWRQKDKYTNQKKCIGTFLMPNGEKIPEKKSNPT